MPLKIVILIQVQNSNLKIFQTEKKVTCFNQLVPVDNLNNPIIIMKYKYILHI